MEFECSKPNFISAFLRISLHCSAFRYNSMKLAAIHCHISKPFAGRRTGESRSLITASSKRFALKSGLVAFVWWHSSGRTRWATEKFVIFNHFIMNRLRLYGREGCLGEEMCGQ